MVLSLTIYEYGELCGNTTSLIPHSITIKRYFQDIWNLFDFIGLSLLMVWLGLRFNSIDNFVLFKGFLSMSAIFYSLSMLCYFSIFESIGMLTLMVFAMIMGLLNFLLLFIVCIWGFWVTLFSLMKYDSLNSPTFQYGSPLSSAVTLFGAIFANFSIDQYDISNPYQWIHVSILTVYIVFTTVILLNLIIARMSNTHQEVSNRSFEKWNFFKATLLKKFILVKERHPFSMLPAPFNVIPIVLSPVHFYWMYSQGKDNDEPFISVCGTASDVTMAFVMSFLAPIFELSRLIYLAVHSFVVNEISFTGIEIFQLLSLIILSPIGYVPYVLSLLFASCNQYTRVLKKRTSRQDSTKKDSFYIFYPEKPRFEKCKEFDLQDEKNDFEGEIV
jgi:hypothetical protein